MSHSFFSILAEFSADDMARIRFISLFVILIGGLSAGYITNRRLGMSDGLAKKIMTAVLVCLNCPVGIFIVWRMQLSLTIIWLPVISVVLMLLMTGLSVLVFGIYNIHNCSLKQRITLVLAGGMSNLSHTGGAIVCYALFGFGGLALAQIYMLFWGPVIFLGFFPLLRMFEIHNNTESPRFSIRHFFDFRMLVIPAVILGIAMNLSGIKFPEFVVDYYILDFFIYLGAALSFFAIGLRVRFRQVRKYMPLYFSTGTIKFIVTPLVAILLLKAASAMGSQMGPLAGNVIMVQSVAPCAVTMVTMSHIFDLDGLMASTLWIVNTAIFAAVVAPILFFIFT